MTTDRSRRTLRALALTAILLLAAACNGGGATDGDGNGGSSGGGQGDGNGGGGAIEGPTIVVRGQDFSESITIAEVYGQYLRGLGYDVDILTPAGFRTEAIADLESGSLGLIVDYIGGSQTALAPDSPSSSDPDETIEVIGPAYTEIGATVLDYAPAVNGDAFVVRDDSPAERISDVADLDYVFGASAQCYERPQCYLGFTDADVYGITFADTRTIEYGPLLGEALAAGEVDAVMWEDTAPAIELLGLKVLEDDRGLFPVQNIAPIVRTELLEAYGDRLADDLNALSARITTDDLRAWNIETDVEFREHDAVAEEWLRTNDLL